MQVLQFRGSGSEACAGLADCIHDTRLERLEFFFAQGAVGGLECCADEERIIMRTKPDVAEDFGGAPVHEFGDLDRCDRPIDALPWNALIEDE